MSVNVTIVSADGDDESSIELLTDEDDGNTDGTSLEEDDEDSTNEDEEDEFLDELLGLSITTPTVNWKAPITGVSVSISGQNPPLQTTSTNIGIIPSNLPIAPQQSFVLPTQNTGIIPGNLPVAPQQSFVLPTQNTGIIPSNLPVAPQPSFVLEILPSQPGATTPINFSYGSLQGFGGGTTPISIQPVMTQVQPQLPVQSQLQSQVQPQLQSQVQSQLPVQFEKIGRQFIVKTTPGLLNAYGQYFQALRGKYEETIQGSLGMSTLVGQWVFPSTQEQDVRRVLTQIFNGQLPPPAQLAPAMQISLDSANIPGAPVSQPTTQIPSQIVQSTNIQVPTQPVGRGRGRGRGQTKPATEQTVAPSQIIASTLGQQQIQTAPPSVIGQIQSQVPLPSYDPTQRDPGESQAEYDRRHGLYQRLIRYQLPNGATIPPDTADVLSRMRNNVDIEGVGYNDVAMKILNTYLPIAK